MSINKTASLLTIFVILQGVLRVLIPVYSTVILINIILTLVCIILIYTSRNEFKTVYIQKKNLVFYFLFYGLFILVYSCFVAKTYEQWRYVFTVFFPSLLLPFFTLIGGKPDGIKAIVKMLFLVGIPMSFLLYFSEIRGMGDFTHYISFTYILLLMFPFVQKKWRLILLTISILSLLYDIDSRVNIMNFSVVGLILFIYYLISKNRLKIIFNILRKIFFITPIFFLLLGITGVFNIYSFGDEYNNIFTVEYSNQKTSLVQDTRTGIYEDALKGIVKDKAYLFGISAAGSHETSLKDVSDDFFELLKNGRLGSEVGILEYLLRGGIFYVFLIFFLHYFAAKVAINQSNNTFSKLLGLFIAFRWFFLFVEGQASLDLSNITIFLTIGVCLNPAFRNLNDLQIKHYIFNFFRR